MEPSPALDARTDAEHDCDRILYSDELRRLGGVTQVVAVGEMPLFHTRLTHTLKVQQLARRMAEHLARDSNRAAAIAAVGGIDPSAAEAAGLAHDLGHPPFGHVGEAALSAKCRAAGLDGFEGNAQTFRILTKLSRRGEDTPHGLDISSGTLRAVIKYPWLRSGSHEQDSKWNAYPTEAYDFRSARSGLPDEGRSIEACIMDWSDDITYAVHDLEDFIRAGRVPIVELASDKVARAEFVARAVSRLAQKYPTFDWDLVAETFALLLRTLFTQFKSHAGTAEDLARLRTVSRALIGNYVGAIDVQPGNDPLVVSDLVRGQVELFKQLTWHYVIHDPALATLQLGQARVVNELFDTLRDWLEDEIDSSRSYRLPRRLYDLYQITLSEPGHEAYANKKARLARAVADYIASLTETQARDLNERLHGAAAQSVTDPWLSY